MSSQNQELVFQEAKDEAGFSNLSTLAETIWYEFFPSIISLEQIEYMLNKFLSPEAIKKDVERGYRFYLCKLGREYVGFISIHPEQNWNSSGTGRRLFLSKLYLVQNVRGYGLATQMIRKIFQLARDNSCTQVYLTVNKYNSNAINIYYHWGFRKTESIQTDIGGGFIMDDYVMSCSVDEFKV
ncbi:MAG: GNAT family N-acetyltransferase [Succinivibrionaceae bacterium]